MSKPPLAEAVMAMLRKPNPAVITTGQPVSAATWYLWDNGRVLVNMDEGRKRLEHLRGDPRVALDVLDESDWHTQRKTSRISSSGSRSEACRRSSTVPATGAVLVSRASYRAGRRPGGTGCPARPGRNALP